MPYVRVKEGGVCCMRCPCLCVCVSVCEYVYLYVSVCECVLGVHTVRNPPANEKALCRVQPYCILRAGPFVRVYRTTKRRHH